MTDLSSFPITRKWPAAHPERLQLYSLPTPNGVKVSILLEETGLPYEPHLVNFATNDQLTPEFMSLNPNNKIPAIIDPDGPGVTEALARLRRECVEAKEALSVDTATTVPVALPDLLTTVRVTRVELEQLVAPVVEQTMAALARAVRGAGLVPGDLSGIVLVGGSSRIPLVGEALQQRLGGQVAQDHAQIAGILPFMALALLVATVLVQGLRSMDVGVPLRLPALLTGVVVAVALVWTVRAGHSGSEAVWGPVVDSTSR